MRFFSQILSFLVFVSSVDAGGRTNRLSDSQNGINNIGSQVAVWQAMGPNNSVIQFSYSLAHSSWLSTPVTLSSSQIGDAYNPQVILTNENKVVAVWQRFQPDTKKWAVESAYYTLGGSSWSSPQVISNALGDAYLPGIASDENGNCLVAWVGAQEQQVQYAIFSDTSKTWSTPLSLSSEPVTYSLPEVVMNDSGQFIIAWQAVLETNNIIQCVRGALGGGLGSIETLSSPDTDSALVQGEINNAGEVFMAWQTTLSEGIGIQVQSLANFSAPWGTPQVWYVAGSTAQNVQLALNEAGEAVAVWQQQDGDNISSIKASLYSPSAGWQDVNTLSDTSFNSTLCSCSYDDNGNLFAFWQGAIGETSTIFYNTYSFGPKAWSPTPFSLSGDAQGYYPQIQNNQANQAFVIWQQTNSLIDVSLGASLFSEGEWATAFNIPD